MTDSARRVVCAAIRAADGSLLLGIRHYSNDMHIQIAHRDDGWKFLRSHAENQGFVDQHGIWMGRFEAYQVALNAQQIICLEACHNGELYSEGLY
jgi:hypothetical protein